jgi:kynurenine formamidase
MAAWRVRVPTPCIFVILGGLALCLGAALLITAGSCTPRSAARSLVPGESALGRYIDLTHAFDEQTVYWPTEEGFKLIKGFEGHTEAGYYYAAHRFEAAEHGGTHIDAPIHFYEGGAPLEQVPLERLIGPGVVVDATDRCLRDRDYQIQLGDLKDWEAKQGRSLNDAIVLLRTGFARYWPERRRYLGTDQLGAGAIAKLHFPGLHPEAARWLASERTVKAVGIDTASIDYGQSRGFETHIALLRAGIPGLENLAGLEQLPASGFTVVALPMKIKGGSGGPLRAVAIVPD